MARTSVTGKQRGWSILLTCPILWSILRVWSILLTCPILLGQPCGQCCAFGQSRQRRAGSILLTWSILWSTLRSTLRGWSILLTWSILWSMLHVWSIPPASGGVNPAYLVNPACRPRTSRFTPLLTRLKWISPSTSPISARTKTRCCTAYSD